MVMKDIKHTKEDFKEWLNEKITYHLSLFPSKFNSYAPTQNHCSLGKIRNHSVKASISPHLIRIFASK